MRNRVKDPNAAGHSSELRFRQARRLYWAEDRKLMIAGTIIAPVLLLLAWGLKVSGPMLYLLVFVAGFDAALALVNWMVVPKRVQNFRIGADGEAQTAKELDRLTNAGWRPVHDRALDRCNVDHIQIGPGGVFVIETKNWQGKIRVNDRGVSQDGTVRDRVAPNARRAAFQINQRISANGAKPGWVNAVVVFWGDFEQGMVEQDRVTYLHGDQLIDWLRSRPARLNGIEVDQFASIIATMRPGVELSLAS